MKNQLTTLVIGETTRSVRGTKEKSKAEKSGPHYFPASVPHQVAIDTAKANINGKEIIFSVQGYEPDIVVVQTTLDVSDIFDQKTIFDLEERCYAESYKLLKARGGNEQYSELYSIFRVSGYKGDPEQFLKNHAADIAGLLKSEKVPLDPKEIEYTVSAQIKYAKHDLSIVDWDGAFLFDTEGDFGLAIELLTLANLQLLRHRILDRKLDERLARITALVKQIEKRHLFRNKALVDEIKNIIRDRITLISAFQSLERDLKLIGDWYSARFYDLAARKFKLNEWRTAIKEKLESIQDIYETFTENFTFSRKDRVEWIEIAAWFVIILLEFVYLVK